MKKYTELHEFDTPIYKYNKKGVEALKMEELILLMLTAGDDTIDVRLKAKRIIQGQYIEAFEALREVERRATLSQNTKIASAKDIYDNLREFTTKKQEHFVLITLDGASHIINIHTVFIGTLNQSLVHPREVFSLALKDRSAGIIIAHNHPSGTLTPSRADIQITQRLKEVSKLVGIELLDHVILAKSGFYSFADEGVL